MSEHSAISWTNATWNPVAGCSHVSEGCRNCYAEQLSLRMGWSQKPWTAPNARANVRLHPDRLEYPLRWRRPRMIFVNSMSDLFHELVPDDFIDRVFAIMALTPWHTYQVLTKRPARMLEYMTEQWQADVHQTSAGGFRGRGDDRRARVMRAVEGLVYGTMIDFFGPARWWTPEGGSIAWAQPWPLPNVWLGTSVEDQRNADERIPPLLQTPATIRFLSCEPLLGPMLLHRDFRPWKDLLDGIHWLIAGGESGRGFRPMDLTWALLLQAQCRSAGVPFFMKQDSGLRPGRRGRIPDDLWVQEMPEALAKVELGLPT